MHKVPIGPNTDPPTLVGFPVYTSVRVARLDHSLAKGEHHKSQLAAHAQSAQQRAAELAATRQKAQAYVAHINGRRDKEMERLKTEWETRNKHLWDHIEGVIRGEEEKVRVKQEEERKRREEEERLRREVEERKRKEEEKRRQEEEERRKEKEREEEEERKLTEAAEARKEKEAAEAGQRKQLGFSSASEDWQRARENLKWLKTGPMKIVKETKELRSLWSAGRRAITPKVGQLTNDPESINRITRQLIDVVCGKPQHPEPVYFALLSSLAKAILLQAETEVTAEKRSAGPLAQVTANLLSELDSFAEAFWAKLCQRTGGWPIPIVVPPTDWDSTPFSEEERRKALGYRKDEGLSDYTTRVTGIMRVYFHILFAEVGSPLEPVFRLPRMWTYFARMLGEPMLLHSAVGPSVLHGTSVHILFGMVTLINELWYVAALDIGGVRARQIWGKQWVKLLAQLYEAATAGLGGKPGRLLGGDSSEGIAARVRVQLAIERIMAQ
ncbi:hypothetical protein EVJ58_g9982 [Rhodofomes roseus]|uniref:mRNA export factor GLE1 n=1 Tax=Rhodofomes roseus TaxID=34475 RepID=A0A4Y9XSX9_9APHY|nr:hypothetical protein EVJ58_g9982 [Rhodofomes roseus]